MLQHIFGDGLPEKVVIYIPTTTDIDKPLDNTKTEQYVDRAMRFLASRFGGATAQTARGAWVAKDGKLVSEQVHLVYAYAKTLNAVDAQAIHAFCEQLRDELTQEAIAAEVGGELRFI